MKIPPIESRPIGRIGLSTRAFNTLTRYGITTFGDAARLTEHEISRWKCTGPKTIREIRRRLQSEGLDFAPPPPNANWDTLQRVTDLASQLGRLRHSLTHILEQLETIRDDLRSRKEP